jgi:hypothetical protein
MTHTTNNPKFATESRERTNSSKSWNVVEHVSSHSSVQVKVSFVEPGQFRGTSYRRSVLQEDLIALKRYR